MPISRNPHAVRAAERLSSGNDDDLPYAALELRMAIERIVYDTLRAYATRLPPDVLDTWQPPQAVKALIEFEPSAARTRRIRFGVPPAKGAPATHFIELGEDRAFQVAWLRKNYNKLGNILHVPTPRNEARARDSSRACYELW